MVDVPKPYDLTVLPRQAIRIAMATSRTGAAVGLSQSGSVITIHEGDGKKTSFDAQGYPIEPQKETLC